MSTKRKHGNSVAMLEKSDFECPALSRYRDLLGIYDRAKAEVDAEGVAYSVVDAGVRIKVRRRPQVEAMQRLAKPLQEIERQFGLQPARPYAANAKAAKAGIK